MKSISLLMQDYTMAVYVTLYVVENNRGQDSLQWTDTEKSICLVSGKSEYQGATIPDRG